MKKIVIVLGILFSHFCFADVVVEIIPGIFDTDSDMDADEIKCIGTEGVCAIVVIGKMSPAGGGPLPNVKVAIPPRHVVEGKLKEIVRETGGTTILLENARKIR